MTIIVKVQRALYPPDAPWLAYDQRRTFNIMFEPTDEVREMMGKDLKAYFKAEPPRGKRQDLSPATIHLLEKIKPQPW